MKKLFVISVVILSIITMSTAGFATENEAADSQTTTDVQETEYIEVVNDTSVSMFYSVLKRAYFGNYFMDDETIEYGDINENGEIDADDYTLFKRAYFGIYDLGDIGEVPVEKPNISYKDLYANDYDEYVDVLKDITLPDYFVSYDDVSIFGEFDYFVCFQNSSGTSGIVFSNVYYTFVDEAGAGFSLRAYYMPEYPYEETITLWPEIDSENINASDMRTANVGEATTTTRYVYQGIEYRYSKHGTLMSIIWNCGDYKYVLSSIGDYPITDKDTAVNRLLNLESAPSVIAGLKGNVSETSASE